MSRRGPVKRPRGLSLERLERRWVPSAVGFAPRISGPSRFTVVEDTATTVRVRVTDSDSSELSVKLVASTGYLSARAAPGVTVVSSRNRVVDIAGPRSGVNKTLETVTFKPYADDTRQLLLTVTASDGVNVSSHRSTIRIVPVNDAPTVSVLGRLFATRGSVDLGDNPVFDPDSGRLTVTLSSDNGSVRILDPAARNLGSESRLVGNPATINAILASPRNIVLAPTAARNTRLTITADDGSLKTARVVLVSHRENLSQIAAAAVDSRLAGQDPAIAKPLYSVMDHATANYVRNKRAWTQDLDLTSISPWNSAGGSQMAGTLVSPRHIVFATHFQLPVGAKVRFVSRENEVVERTLVGTMSEPYVKDRLFPDITVGVLDSDVPPSIGFARILPDDWAAYVPDGRLEIPCLALDQEEKALVTSLWFLGAEASFTDPRDPAQRSFFEPLVRGDSGNPGFMIVDGQLVLMTVWTYGSGGLGTFVTGQRAAIDRMMSALGGGYRLTPVDLSRLGRL